MRPAFTLIKQPDGRWRPSSPLVAMIGIAWRGTIKSVLRPFEGIAEWLRLREGHALRPGGVPGKRTLLTLLQNALAKLAPRRPDSYGTDGARCGRRAVGIHALIRRELFNQRLRRLHPDVEGGLDGIARLSGVADVFVHLDSMIIYQAHYSDIKEIYLASTGRSTISSTPPGSGFTPESSDKLFQRLEALGIPYLDWIKDVEPMIKEMNRTRTTGSKVTYNGEDWG